MAWTDERVELLKKLNADGLSASQIARVLGGTTRNSVIGKLHRGGIITSQEPTWPPEKIERLRALVEAGLPASKIADELGGGITRRAVIGKMRREKIPSAIKWGARKPTINHLSGTNTRADRIADRRRALDTRWVATECTDLPPDESPFACTFMELTDKTCRYPMGDPKTPEFRFCGDVPYNKLPYCPRHCVLSFPSFQTNAERKL